LLHGEKIIENIEEVGNVFTYPLEKKYTHVMIEPPTSSIGKLRSLELVD
jgi:hypothetical protein